MTPRDLDLEVVHLRAHRLRDVLDRLASAGEVTAERLEEDDVLSAAVCWWLVQVVELAVSINSHVAAATLGKGPLDYRQSFALAGDVGLISPALAERLAPSTGLRNVLVHEYVRVDLRTVAAAVPAALEGYGRYVEVVARFLSARGGQEPPR